MKTPALLLISFLFCLLIPAISFPQTGSGPGIENPLSGNQTLFANDIILSNQPQQDQRDVKICSAFNGWLYATYKYDSASNTRIAIQKSVDNGNTWGKFQDFILGLEHEIIPSLEIATCGNSESTLKVILAMTYYDTLWQNGGISVPAFNGTTGGFIKNLFMAQGGDPITDVAIASDYVYPAVGSTGGSIAVLYIQRYPHDSLLLFTSSNGASSLTKRVSVRGTSNSLGKIAITYGRSSSHNTGQYFITWEETSSSGTVHHIYATRTDTSFNSKVIKPVCLDSLNPSWINQCSRPAIACQSSGYDNAYGNLTEVVLFDKVNPGSSERDVVGCYNLHAGSTSVFQPMTLASTLDNECQPHACFNSFDSAFNVVMYNATQQKIALLRKGVNLSQPDTWQVISPGFNDDATLENPYPQVATNVGVHQVAMTWVKEGQGGNGVALFDAPYHFYTGTNDPTGSPGQADMKVFPNPAAGRLHIDLSPFRSGQAATLEIFNQYGQHMGTVAVGQHDRALDLDVSSWSRGMYLLRLVSNGGTVTEGKVVVN